MFLKTSGLRAHVHAGGNLTGHAVYAALDELRQSKTARNSWALFYFENDLGHSGKDHGLDQADLECILGVSGLYCALLGINLKNFLSITDEVRHASFVVLCPSACC